MAYRDKQQEKLDDEKRYAAVIPAGKKDYKGISFMNKYNDVEMTITASKVTDSGVVLWFSETREVYTTADLENHWVHTTLAELGLN